MMAAVLLKDRGFDVFGVHFSTGFEGGPSKTEMDALAGSVGVPLHHLDLSAAFRHQVVDYFIASYQAGRTPNPCLVCNPEIKFGRLLEASRTLGAECLATGHYARVQRDGEGKYHLYRGVDSQKDQSYFLSRLTQDHLSHALFPLGDRRKADVKALAFRRGLRPVTRGESQDVCFIRKSTYSAFLRSLPGFSPAKGIIQDRGGRVLGTHEGLHQFTVGQRRGIGCPAAEPYYVLELQAEKGRLIVGGKAETYAASCRAEGVRWILNPPPAGALVEARIRYRHRGAASLVRITGADTVQVSFQAPQKAVTPGQGVVFYSGDEVLGAGWITGSGAPGECAS